MSKAIPKYWKEKYDIWVFDSYKDIPGWINDAEFIYPQMVEQAQDGDHFVEIGTLLGQSTSYMCQLIKDSGKDIKFDSIDLFWPIEHVIRNYKNSGHPKEFNQYLSDLLKEYDLRAPDIINHPLRILGVQEYVNLITCDEKYAHRLYDDNSLKFVWIDGDHGKDIVYNDLKNFWPKIKSGGTIGGDDIAYQEVLDDVKKFSKEYDVKVKYDYNSFLITKE
jgi:predicted O-methyltransferase YrrM